MHARSKIMIRMSIQCSVTIDNPSIIIYYDTIITAVVFLSISATILLSTLTSALPALPITRSIFHYRKMRRPPTLPADQVTDPRTPRLPILRPENPTPPPSPSRLYRRSASLRCEGSNWPRWGFGGSLTSFFPIGVDMGPLSMGSCLIPPGVVVVVVVVVACSASIAAKAA